MQKTTMISEGGQPIWEFNFESESIQLCPENAPQGGICCCAPLSKVTFCNHLLPPLPSLHFRQTCNPIW